MFIKNVIGLLSILVFMIASFFVFKADAFAGSEYNGKSPYYNDCASSAITAKVAYFPNGKGQVQLKYSTKCRTTWGKVVLNSPLPYDGQDGFAGVYRDGSNLYYTCFDTNGSGGIGGGETSCYTPMLDDAGYTSSASGWVGFQGTYSYAQTGSY